MITKMQSNLRTEPTAARSSARRVRLIATAVVALHLIVLGAAWYAIISAGDDGTFDTYELPINPNGVTIAGVEANGPADRAGLRPGDIIFAINSVSTQHGSAFHSVIHSYRPGQTVHMLVRHIDGAPPVEIVTVTLRSRLANAHAVIDIVGLTIVSVLFMAVAFGVIWARPTETAAQLHFLAAGSLAVSQVIALWVYGNHSNWVDPIEPWAFQVTCVAALHLFMYFPAPHPILVRLQRLGPQSLRRLGGGTVLIYVIPLGAALAIRTGPASIWPWWSVLMAGTLGAAVMFLLDNYRHLHQPLARAQARLMLVSLTIGVAAFMFWSIFEILPRSLVLIAATAFPISISIAILRYRLFDIDVFINRTLIYSVLTAILALFYAISVALLQSMFRALTGADSNLAIVVSTLVIAALFSPIRRRTQVAIDRLLYRRKYEAARTLSNFSASLRDDVHTDLDQLSAKLVSVLDATMQTAEVWIWFDAPEQERAE